MYFWLHSLLVVITMLYVIIPSWSPALAQASPDQQTINHSNANSLIRVIIVLKNNLGVNSQHSESADLTDRHRLVAVAQADFVRRQGTLLASVSRRFQLAPMLVADVRMADVALLQRDPAVARVQIDRPHPPALDQSTVLIGSRTVNAAGYAGAGTAVAILDTGVRKTHPFLAGRVIAEACFSTTNSSYGSTSLCPGGVPSTTAVNSALPCASDVSGCNHGTHVAGIVAGNRLTVDGRAVSGVAPDAKLIAVQIYSRFPAGGGYCGASDCALSFDSDQIAALEWLYTQRATPAWGTLAAVWW
jgi:subtilisin family serine protease